MYCEGPRSITTIAAPNLCFFWTGGRRILDVSPLNSHMVRFGEELINGGEDLNGGSNGDWQLGALINDNSTYQAVEPTALLAVHGYVVQVLHQLS